VLNVFAPLAVSEYRRVLKSGGCLFLVIPGENHLFEMKEVLYDTPRKNEVSDFALPGFSLLSGTPLTYSFRLKGQESISALFSMTPYYYRTPEGGKARLAALDTLELTADFHLLTYRVEENQARS
ncbi:MAG: methyltransferase, partial [Eubacteriales bacterium]